MFIYSQLQSILPDTTLGNISDCDRFLQLNLNQPELPFKSADEYVLNEYFHRLVVASKLPRPSKFVDQSIAFGKALCKQLLEHEIANSGLIKGLCAFDPAVILDGPESHYITAIEKLSSHFVSMKLITSSDKAKVTSQYRSLVINCAPSQSWPTMIGFTSFQLITRSNVGLSCFVYISSPVYECPLL